MKKIINLLISSVILTFSSLFVMTASADIFKCVGTDGNTYYKDKPCPLDNKETELKAVKDPVNGYIPPAFVPDENESKKSGVVVGNESNKSTNKKDSYDETANSVGADGIESNSKGSLKENNSNSQGDTASERTDSDIAFNANLETKSLSSNKSADENSLKNLLVLEPSGKKE